MRLLSLSCLESYPDFDCSCPPLPPCHHCLPGLVPPDPSPPVSHSSLSLCLLSSPSMPSSWLAQQNLPTLDLLILSAFCPLGLSVFLPQTPLRYHSVWMRLRSMCLSRYSCSCVVHHFLFFTVLATGRQSLICPFFSLFDLYLN